MTRLRTVTFLTREQIDFLDQLGKDALFYKGSKLSRAHILAEMVDLLMQLGIDIKKIDLKHGNHLAREILKGISSGYDIAGGPGQKKFH